MHMSDEDLYTAILLQERTWLFMFEILKRKVGWVFGNYKPWIEKLLYWVPGSPEGQNIQPYNFVKDSYHMCKYQII